MKKRLEALEKGGKGVAGTISAISGSDLLIFKSHCAPGLLKSKWIVECYSFFQANIVLSVKSFQSFLKFMD